MYICKNYFVKKIYNYTVALVLGDPKKLWPIYFIYYIVNLFKTNRGSFWKACYSIQDENKNEILKLEGYALKKNFTRQKIFLNKKLG